MEMERDRVNSETDRDSPSKHEPNAQFNIALNPEFNINTLSNNETNKLKLFIFFFFPSLIWFLYTAATTSTIAADMCVWFFLLSVPCVCVILYFKFVSHLSQNEHTARVWEIITKIDSFCLSAFYSFFFCLDVWRGKPHEILNHILFNKFIRSRCDSSFALSSSSFLIRFGPTICI